MQESAAQQLLMNLVRLKYRDSPVFLEVGSVSSQVALDSATGAQGTITDPMRHFVQKTLNLSQTLTYGARPTVSYLPLQGDVFVKRILSPISLDNIVLLANSGWSMDRVFKLCAQQMNDLPNAPTASGPTPQSAPEFRQFVTVTRLMQTLQIDGRIVLGYVTRGDEKLPVLRINKGNKDAAELTSLLNILGLKPGQTVYPMFGDVQDGPRQKLTLSMRSFLSVLFYLSQAVEVPEQDVKKGLVTQTQADNGRPFDWSPLLGDVMRIHSSGIKPPRGPISVYYRHHWFYIDDADLDSKSTFFLLTQLLALQAGSAPAGAAPVLTLPVGR